MWIFQNDQHEGLSLSSWYITRRQERKKVFYKWESDMPTVEPGAIGVLIFIMNGNMMSLWNTVTALYKPV